MTEKEAIAVQLIIRIRSVIDDKREQGMSAQEAIGEIKQLVDAYEPDYTTGPIVGMEDNTPFDNAR